MVNAILIQIVINFYTKYIQFKSIELGRAPVAHAYNPIYSRGRDQEDRSSKPAGASNSQDPILKKPFTKIGLVGWLKVKALSSSPSIENK
jgi:hypothetical protein